MKEPACPQCQHPFNSVTIVADGLLTITPTPGEITVCLYCAAILKFSDEPTITAREADLVDLAELPEEVLDALALARHTVRAAHYQHTLRRE